MLGSTDEVDRYSWKVVSAVEDETEDARAIISQHRACNVRALTQVLTKMESLAFLRWIALRSVNISHWLTVTAALLISLFMVRAFALVHECGHGSLFRTQWLNRTFGFLRVITGMPQYVWSKHHNFHHAHNGNWQK
jgi:omega-6 fatty acid desaturase (delta-12 desaturase)